MCRRTVLCWGSNIDGTIGVDAPERCGDVAPIRCATRPVAVRLGEDIDREMVAPRVAAGGTQFQSISAGSLHACGLDQRGRVLCWGDTIRGALGIR